RGERHEADPVPVRRVSTRTFEQPIVDRGLAGLGHREPASAEGDDRCVHGGVSCACAAHCSSLRSRSASYEFGVIRSRQYTSSTSFELGDIRSGNAVGPLVGAELLVDEFVRTLKLLLGVGAVAG